MGVRELGSISEEIFISLTVLLHMGERVEEMNQPAENVPGS